MLNEYERRQLAGIEARLRADSPELFGLSGGGALRPASPRGTRWWVLVGLALVGVGQLSSSAVLAWLGLLVLMAIAAAWIARDVRHVLARLPPTTDRQ